MLLADILHNFNAFGPVHLIVLIVVAVATWALVRHRRRLPAEPDRRRFDVALGVAALTVWMVNQTLEMMPWRFALHRSLPLHVCDVVGVFAALAMITGSRPWRAMLYYWGVGLSTQALITPELAYGLASFDFWSFWVPHGTIIALAVYDLVARGFRPGWRDYAVGVATLLVYLAVVLPFDLAYHVNYGFVGRGTPGQPSVIDFLGPWPIRTYKLCVGVAIFLALITVPWVVARRVSSRRAGAGAGRPAAAGSAAATPSQPAPRSPVESLEARGMF